MQRFRNLHELNNFFIANYDFLDEISVVCGNWAFKRFQKRYAKLYLNAINKIEKLDNKKQKAYYYEQFFEYRESFLSKKEELLKNKHHLFLNEKINDMLSFTKMKHLCSSLFKKNKKK